MKKLVMLILSLAFIFPAFSQKVRLVEGSVAPLKGQTAIAVEFTYDNLKIGMRGKETEAEYIADRKQKMNEKEAGKGDKWAVAWVADRKDRFEPQFRELCSKHAEMTTAGSNPTYTMIFKTTQTEPGFNVGITRMPAFINGEALIVETANKDKVVARITVERSPGRDAWGFDFDTGTRLQEAYAKAGKEIAQFIVKQNKK
ncbi:MAG TPA: hypothetical protein DGG95_15075 [Cytophagales bacterium]|nr:hypothetical protein [Cytophagales bacterium]